MNQAPTRKTPITKNPKTKTATRKILQKKTLHENQYKQIKEESFFRRRKGLWWKNLVRW